MADLKISEMTPAAELTGAELIECVQGGVNVKQELTGLKTWVNDGVQPFSSTLDALSSFNTNGIMVQTDTSEFIGRTITGTASQIVVSNGDGVSGNPVVSLAESGITADTYGSSTQIPVTTYTAQGIATSVVNTEISFPTQFSDSTFRIQDNVDATKQLALEVTGIATGTTKTWTAPNADINFGDLANIATTSGNVLSGTRTRIVGGLANTVSGTDNVAVNCTATTISGTTNSAYGCKPSLSLSITGSYCTAINCRAVSASLTGTGVTVVGGEGYNVAAPENNSIVLGTSTQSNLFIFGTAAALRLNGLWAAITTIPVAGTAYATIDGSQTLSNANCLRAVTQSGCTSSHEVEFIVSVGLANGSGGCIPIGSFTAKRSINVHQATGGTYYTGTMQTIGTDESLGTIGGTFTPAITVDTVNNRLVCSVVRAGGVAGQEAFVLSARTSSHSTR